MNRSNFLKISGVILLVLMLLPLLSPDKLVVAVNPSPSSATYSFNSSHTINLLAAPPGAGQGVQIRLTVSGPLTITAYTPPAAFLATGVCTGGVSFTATTVCVDLAKIGGANTVAGESLGTITVHAGSTSGTAIIARGTDNGYQVGNTVVPQTGTAGTYTIGNLPSTALSSNDMTLLYGAGLIILGVIVFRMRFKAKTHES